jgi:hypothetical protein
MSTLGAQTACTPRIFDYWNDNLSGHTHVKRTYPDVVRMWRQFHGCSGSGQLFFDLLREIRTVKVE